MRVKCVAGSTMTDIEVIKAPSSAYPFIRDSFLKSWYDAARGGRDREPVTELAQLMLRACEQAPPAFLYEAMDRYLEIMLARSRTLVAIAAESPSVYIGWLSANDDTLEYVYVKRDARRLGIARDLMRAAGTPLTRQALVTWPWTRRLTHKGQVVNE